MYNNTVDFIDLLAYRICNAVRVVSHTVEWNIEQGCVKFCGCGGNKCFANRLRQI